jgi:hypothetical protein
MKMEIVLRRPTSSPKAGWFFLFLSSIVDLEELALPLHSSHDSCIFLGKRERISRSIFPPINIFDGNNSIIQMHLLGLQAQSDAKREVFPHKGDLGLLPNSRGSLRLVPYLFSSSNLQQ